MNNEIFNIYVEKILNEVTELSKSKLLIAAQLTYYEKINAALAEQNKRQETIIATLQEELTELKEAALDKASNVKRKSTSTVKGDDTF